MQDIPNINIIIYFGSKLVRNVILGGLEKFKLTSNSVQNYLNFKEIVQL